MLIPGTWECYLHGKETSVIKHKFFKWGGYPELFGWVQLITRALKRRKKKAGIREQDVTTEVDATVLKMEEGAERGAQEKLEKTRKWILPQSLQKEMHWF